MDGFISLLFSFMHRLLDTLDWDLFRVYGQVVTLLDLIVGFILFSIVASVFWKGVKY